MEKRDLNKLLDIDDDSPFAADVLAIVGCSYPDFYKHLYDAQMADPECNKALDEVRNEVVIPFLQWSERYINEKNPHFFCALTKTIETLIAIGAIAVRDDWHEKYIREIQFSAVMHSRAAFEHKENKRKRNYE